MICLRKVDVDGVMYVVELARSKSLAGWRNITKTWTEEGTSVYKMVVAMNGGMGILLAKCRTLGFVSFVLLIPASSLIVFIVVHVGYSNLVMVRTFKSL